MLGKAAAIQADAARPPQARRGDARVARAGPAAVHPAPHQGAGRERPAARSPSRRSTATWNRRSASCTTSCATTTGIAARARRARRDREVEDPGPRGAAAAAAGGLPPRSDRQGKRSANRAPSSTCSLPQLHEVFDEGHKTLVFSQFTSMLAIVRDAARRGGDPLRVPRRPHARPAARVERFQNDPDCKVFLISLKAGGLGLNLTAADYVFLLDPWWNPAVEARRSTAPTGSARRGRCSPTGSSRGTRSRKRCWSSRPQAGPGRRHRQRRRQPAALADA